MSESSFKDYNIIFFKKLKCFFKWHIISLIIDLNAPRIIKFCELTNLKTSFCQGSKEVIILLLVGIFIFAGVIEFYRALECPVKLYYSGKDEYPDQKKDDDFLAALAEGGFQVG